MQVQCTHVYGLGRAGSRLCWTEGICQDSCTAISHAVMYRMLLLHRLPRGGLHAQAYSK